LTGWHDIIAELGNDEKSKELLRNKLRNEALITSETFKPNLTGFKNRSGLV